MSKTYRGRSCFGNHRHEERIKCVFGDYGYYETTVTNDIKHSLEVRAILDIHK